MNYKKRDDELIKLNKQAKSNVDLGDTSWGKGYSQAALKKLKNGTYGSTREIPHLKATTSNAAPNKASEMNPKPSTRYQNQIAAKTETKTTRDTKYDKDFDEFHKYRLGDYSAATDYDPKTDTSTEHWRTVKESIKRKNKWSDEEFESRWNAYNDERNKKAANAEVQSAVNTAKKSGVLGTLQQAIYTPQTWIEGASSMLSNLLPEKYKAQSADDTLFTGTRAKEAAKQTVKDEHIKSTIGKGAYDIGTSVADMALASAVPFLGAATLGTETAARTNMNALERGVDPNKAAATAGIAGLTSGILNKVGLDKAVNATGKTALSRLGQAALTEGAENVAEDSANYIADTLINKDKSQLGAMHDYYVSQGMSDDEAWNQVRKDTLKDYATSFGSGALFGGIMNGVRNIPELTSDIKALDRYVNLNNRGGVDAPALLEEARSAMKAPAKVGNKLAFEPVEGEIRDKIQAEYDANTEQIGKNAAQIETLRTLEETGSKKNAKKYKEQRVALEKENGVLEGQQPELKKMLDGYKSTFKKELDKESYDKIFDGRNGGIVNYLDLGVKFAGDTDEAKALRKEAKKYINAYVESGDSNDYFKALENIGALSKLAEDTKADYVTGNGTVYKYDDFFADTKRPVEMDNSFTRQENLYDVAGEDSPLRGIVEDIHKRIVPQVEAPKAEEGFNDGKLTPEEIQALKDGMNAPDEPEPQKVPELTHEEMAEIQADLEAEGYGANAFKVPEVKNNVPPTEPPKNVVKEEPPRTDKMGKSLVGRNTAVNSKVFTKKQIESHPVISELNKYAKASNDLTFNKAKENIYKDGATLLDEYTNGTRKIDSDIDVDQAMILLTDMAYKIKAGDKGLTAQRNLLFSRLRQAGTIHGQTIQAFKKWNNTPEGVINNAEIINQERVKPWVQKNKKQVEINNRVAKALEQMGVDSSMRKQAAPEKTHEQVREGVKNVIAREFGSVENRFNDSAIEFLTYLAEDKSIPVWVITDEIEHFLNHGEFYTLDESIKQKAAISSKLSTVLKNMGDDRLKESNKPLDNGYPKKSHATIVDEVTNTVNKELAGTGLDTPTDIEFMATMVEEGVPNWQIEDEIRHRLETGEWYTLDEFIESNKPTNQRLKNAFDSLIEKDVVEKEPPTLDEIKDQVRNTFNKEILNRRETGDFNENDVDYFAALLQNGATKEELVSALNTRMATGKYGMSEEAQRDITDLLTYANKFDQDSKQAIELKSAAYKIAAEEMVSDDATPLEKFDSWRYLAMLGNPKTMVRNYVGNKLFSVVTGVSNNLSVALEAGADKAYRAMGGEGIQRTKAFLNPVEDRSLIKAAAEDGDAHRYSELSGTKYEKGVKDAIKSQKSVFNSKLFRLYEAVTDRGISDYNAVKKKYSTSLAGYMKANGLDESAFDADARYRDLKDKSKTQLLTDSERAEMSMLKGIYDQMEKARDFAVKQAEYATFHEDNAVAKALTETSNKWRNSDSAALRGLGYGLESLVPFKKTPANILRSGVEYSPLGAVKSIAETGKLIYENTGKRKGNLEDTYTVKGKITGREREVNKSLAADVLDSWSKTLTGTGLVALGYYLKNKGILNSSTDDEKWQDDLEGKQNYSITINGHTYTLDWAAPAVMPLLVGAEISKVKDRSNLLDQKVYENIDELVGTVNTLFDPLFETSMLQGIKNTMESIANETKYSEGNEAVGGILGSVAFNTLLGYGTQAIPTLSGQLARTVDTTRRTTDTANDSAFLGGIEKQGRKIMNKIPGVSMLNTPYYDSYGRTQQQSPWNDPIRGFLYQSLSPGYLREINTTDADQQARDVYNALGAPNEEGKQLPIMNKDVFPSWKSRVTESGHKYTPEEMAIYRKTSGEAQYAIRDALTKEQWFKDLDGEEQTKILKKVNTLVDKIGRDANGDYSTNKDLATYQEGGIPALFDKWSGGASSSGESTPSVDKETVDAINQQYGSNMSASTYKEKEETYEGGAEQYAKDRQQAQEAGFVTKNGSVQTEQYKKAISQAGAQADKFVNDLPVLQQTGLKKSAYYTYANAINVIPSLTPNEFAKTYNEIDTNKENAMTQKELLEYINKYQWSNDPEEDLKKANEIWQAYGDTSWVNKSGEHKKIKMGNGNAYMAYY